jgi:hypothetical protein
MKIKSVIVFLFSMVLGLKSQTTFQKTYGKVAHDYAHDMQKTKEGGYIVTGSTNSYGGPNYLYLFKTDAAGDTLWARGYVNNAIITGNSVVQTADSGFVVAGATGILRTDFAGNVLWGFSFNALQFTSVQQTSDGGYIICGYIGTSGLSNGIDIYIIKLSASGIKQWSRKLGGGMDDVSYCVRQTKDGGYVSVGNTTSFGAGGTDIYLLKLNNAGDTMWTKTYGGIWQDGGTTAKQSIEQTSDGGFIIGGYTSSYGAGSYDGYLIKTDSLGTVLWSKAYGGLSSELIFSVKTTHDGGYVFVGSTNSFGGGGTDFYVVKTNSAGDTLWTRAFGGANNDYAESVVETDDKGFLIAGYTKSFGSGNNDALLIKIDSMGNSSCNQFTTATTVTSCTTITNSTSTGKIFITLNMNSLSMNSNRGGSIVNLCPTSGIQSIENKNKFLAVFPNPGSGIFTVSVNENYSGTIRISLRNVLGEEIFRSEIKNNTSLDLSGFPNGVYLLSAETENNYRRQIILNK